MINTAVSPYFDDYDQDKKFHRILYRPSYSVQARELNQQQNILMDILMVILKLIDHLEIK